MVTAQSKRAQEMTFLQKHFLNSDDRNGINKYYSVTLPIFAIFPPQTTKIQPFKVERFPTKTLELQHDDSLSMMSVEIWEFCLVY